MGVEAGQRDDLGVRRIGTRWVSVSESVLRLGAAGEKIHATCPKRFLPFVVCLNTNKTNTPMQTTSEYLLLFRGTNWHKGLSPTEIQKVMTQWMAWFDRP